MTPRATTAVYALVGRPVRHSRSPALYNALFAHLGLDAVYVAFDVAPARATGLGDAIRTFGLSGVNLTVPHKAAIVSQLDGLSDTARRADSVNVVVNRDGALWGDSTDGEGFARSLDDAGVAIDGPVVILGAGGAGRAVADALAVRGAPAVTLLNRTVGTAQAVAARFQEHHPSTRWSAAALEPAAFARAVGDASLVVQCTDGPGAAAVAALDLHAVPVTAAWADVNYWMPDPPHVAAARARGHVVVDGDGMLLHQALLALERFTGHRVSAVEARAVLAVSKAQ